MRDSQEFQEKVARIEGLVKKLESSTGPSLSSAAMELVQSVMDLHGAGLERILEIVSSEAGPKAIDALGHDDLVSSLLILYDLHPEDFAIRVQRGLDKARNRGAKVELTGIDGRAVNLRIMGPNHVESTVREALLETAPDAEIVIDVMNGFVPLSTLLTA